MRIRKIKYAQNSPPQHSSAELYPATNARSGPAQRYGGQQPESETGEGIHRRDFIKRTGLALAGVSAASALLPSVRRGMAATTSPTEITFSSAKFFGKETIAEVVNAFNSLAG